MGRRFGRMRRYRDSNAVLAVVGVASAVAFAPFLALLWGRSARPSEWLLTLGWWTGAVVLGGYGLVHVLAAVADTDRFLDDEGSADASAAVVYCHALGQRLPVLVWVGFALVAVTVAGTGIGAPVFVLVSLGLLAATILTVPTAIPRNRRVADRLADYRVD